MTTMIAVTITMPITTGMSPAAVAVDGERSDAREGEDLLDDDRTADHADELHREEGERRDRRRCAARACRRRGSS